MAIPLVASRLTYLVDKVSLRSIARQTGISYTQVWRYSKGLISAPAGFNTAIRNTYQRTVYNEVRGLGMSTEQARRFSWLTPTKAREAETTMKDIVDKMTEGALTASGDKAIREGLSFDTEAMRKHYNWQIKEGLRESTKTLEEWENYFSGYAGTLGITPMDYIFDTPFFRMILPIAD